MMFGAVLAAASLLWWWALPAFVERRLIEALKQRGITASLSGTHVGFLALRIDRASIESSLKIRADLSDIRITLQRLQPRDIYAGHTDVYIDVPLASLLAGNDTAKGKVHPDSALRFESPEVTVHYIDPVEGINHASVEHLKVLVHPDRSFDLTGGELRLVLKAGTAGPWGFSGAREHDETRLAIAIDADKARLLFLRDAKRSRFSLQSKDSKWAHWHLPALPLVMQEVAPDISLTLERIDAETTANGRFRGALELRMTALQIPPLPAAVDVTVLGNVAIFGDELRVEQGTLAIGRMVGGISGALSLPPGPLAFRATGNFRNIPCAAAMADLAPNAATRLLGSLAVGLGVEAGTLDASLRAQYDGQKAPQFHLQISRPCPFAAP